MADYARLMSLEKKRKEQPSPVRTPEPPITTEVQVPQQEQDVFPPQPFQPSQSIGQSTNRLTEQSTNQLTATNEDRVMDKPKGFYITERLNRRLDEAVAYYQEKHHIKKIDRSIIVTAILDDEKLWSSDALDTLRDRVVSQLTNRLTNR